MHGLLKFNHFKMLFCLFLSIGLLSFSNTATSNTINSNVFANSQLKVEYITNNDQKSSAMVMQLAQDHHGILWLGSPSGLSRFDGNKFKQFSFNGEDKNSLPHNFIRALLVDSKDRLWVGTKQGLVLYNVKLENFQRFHHHGLLDNQIWAIFEDKQQRLWVSTQSGVHIFNEKNQRFEPAAIDGLTKTTSLHELKHISQSPDGSIWLGSYGGDSFVLEQTGKRKFKANSLSKTYDLPRQGIHQVTHLNLTESIILTPKEIFLISDGKAIELLKSTSSSQQLNRIQMDANGDFWLASSTGIDLYRLIDQKLTFIQSVVEGQEIYSLLRDKHDTMWFGSHTSGIGRHRLKSDYFTHLSTKYGVLSDNVVWSIKEDNEQKIWVAGNDSRLTRLDFNSQNSKHFDTEIDGAKSLIFDPAGLLYVGSDSGVFRFDLKADDFLGSKIVISNKETAYVTIAKQYLYLGVWGEGLYRISLAPGDNFIHENIQFSDQPIAYITALNSDHNYLYIGMLTGLLKVNLNNGSFVEIKNLNKARVSYIHIDDQDIYVSTASRGVYHFDQRLNTLLDHSYNELLQARSIYTVIVDKNKDQWLATDNGIVNIRSNGDKYLFDQSHGLQGADFNDNSALLASDGTVLFGGVNGLNFIHRNNFDTMVPINAELKFTEFNLFNKAVKIGPDANGFTRISRSIVTKPDITLNYSDYPFELAFNLVNYPFSDQIAYRYRIPGVDHDWIGTKSLASATYTNLSFGSYHLEVEAYLSGSTKAIATNKIMIEVLPPLWLSNWAILGYLVVLLVIVMIVARVISQRRATALEIKIGADRLKLSLWGSGDEMWDWHITENKMFHTEQWDVLDYDGFCDKTLSKIHPDDRETTQKLLQSHLVGDCEYFEANYRIRRKNETQWIWILDRAKVVERNAAGVASRMTGTIRDITKIKAAELKLILQAEAIENISDAIYILDLDYNIVEANKAFETITGYQRSQVFGTGKIFDSYQSNMADLIRAKLNKGEGWSGELKAQRPNGDSYYIELNINTIVENELITHYVAAFSDITNRKQTEIELRNLSNVDTLTKLPNRSYFQHAHRNLIRRNQPHALLTLDIDNFKKINDSMGHDYGDNLLCLISERIDQKIQCQHLLCRLGSDEFAILLEDVDQISTITQVLYEIEVALQEPFVLDKQVLVMSCSVGIGIFPTDGESTENMLQSADTAMYHAKSDSGFSYKFYSASMNESAVRRLQIESLIREALKNDWFEVYYQPKYSAATGLLTGMEALVRLIHPEKGMISPNEFIPVAEDTGLVIEIGEIVLRKACYVTQQWRRSGLFNGRVAVNLAARQFAQTDLVNRISHILDCTQLPVSNLELEITEGTVIEDPEMAIVTMQSLTDLGISLALDDFGTGYSSLSYLKRFPIHTLKIDKAFIDDLTIEQGERHMVASIISIAHNMGLSVVAEGVETKEQLEILKQLSCETIQGFLFSRPLSESDFSALLLKQESLHSDRIVPK